MLLDCFFGDMLDLKLASEEVTGSNSIGVAIATPNLCKPILPWRQETKSALLRVKRHLPKFSEVESLAWLRISVTVCGRSPKVPELS